MTPETVQSYMPLLILAAVGYGYFLFRQKPATTAGVFTSGTQADQPAIKPIQSVGDGTPSVLDSLAMVQRLRSRLKANGIAPDKVKSLCEDITLCVMTEPPAVTGE